ncbi:uncharacterized protein LOC122383785 [Amphibalanus amphitrite]|uniref:uncharacterized protein LOC122383785 n=1 Tax=Amphibalanus amphitrite TaxID=1232801 RepID=UPI001C915653|nr:uncharacterized protein LOC122383785 [Amphibalanus amphitrite]
MSVATELADEDGEEDGLPHAHIIIWLDPEDKPRPDTIDQFVSADIPDPVAEPELHATVTTKMVHGPCGAHRPAASCMTDGVCSKRYPKSFAAVTAVTDNGYPKYRRRSPADGGRTVVLDRQGRQVVIDNRWVVPYNPLLSRALDCHVNFEIITHAFTCIKYVIKYVIKGADQVMFRVADGEEVVDEIATYQQSHYLSAMEAAWRLLAYPVHDHAPTVERLPVHLGGEDQPLRFAAGDRLDEVVQRGVDTKLTSFSKLCAEDDFAATLFYHHEACSALGLLEDGQHWHRAMAEAAVIAFPRQLRRLFAAALWLAQETRELQTFKKQICYISCRYNAAKRKGGHPCAKFLTKAEKQIVSIKLSSVVKSCVDNTIVDCFDVVNGASAGHESDGHGFGSGASGHASDSGAIRHDNQNGDERLTSCGESPNSERVKRASDELLSQSQAECRRLRSENAQLRLDLYRAQLRERRKEQRRPLETYSRRHQHRIKAQLAATAAAYGLQLAPQHTPPPTTETADVRRVTAVLDENNISLRKYSRIAALTPSLPRKHAVRAHQQRLNSSVRVHDCEGGARRDLEDVLTELQPTVAKGNNGSIRVKLAGDGAPAGKYRSFVNITVTLIDEDQPKRTPILLATSAIRENYENLAVILHPINHSVKKL